MGSDNNVLALLDQRQDLLVVVRPDPLRGQLQTLTTGGRDIVRPSPDVNLVLAPLLPRVILVETAKLAVVTLVESLVLVDGDVLLAELLELDTEGGLGTLKGGSEGNVELDTGSSDTLGTGKRFFATKLGESGVLPAGEEVELVPLGLAVTGENESTDHFV